MDMSTAAMYDVARCNMYVGECTGKVCYPLSARGKNLRPPKERVPKQDFGRRSRSRMLRLESTYFIPTDGRYVKCSSFAQVNSGYCTCRACTCTCLILMYDIRRATWAQSKMVSPAAQQAADAIVPRSAFDVLGGGSETVHGSPLEAGRCVSLGCSFTGL